MVIVTTAPDFSYKKITPKTINEYVSTIKNLVEQLQKKREHNAAIQLAQNASGVLEAKMSGKYPKEIYFETERNQIINSTVNAALKKNPDIGLEIREMLKNYKEQFKILQKEPDYLLSKGAYNICKMKRDIGLEKKLFDEGIDLVITIRLR